MLNGLNIQGLCSMNDNKKLLFLNHDVNNQLGVIMGNFEMLQMKTPDLQDSIHTERINNGLLRARELSAELGQSLQDSSNGSHEKKDFVLIAVQEHFIKTSKPAYDKLMEIYNIEITLDISMIDEPKQAYLNPVELIRLRENIISNALAAGATQLHVSLIMKETYLVATFSDNGKGMSQDTLDKILLFQLGDGKVHGIGSRSIVEGANKHGYSITYSSEEGKGTTIRTLVPYYEEETSMA